MSVYKKWIIMQQLNKNKFVKMDPEQRFNVGFKLTLLGSIMSVYNQHCWPL